MFGYIRPFKPNLRVCEFEAYKSAYCALCRTLGKKYGFFHRMLLSYDGAFLVMLSSALSGEEASVERKRCVCNPLKKCNYLCKAKKSLDYAAAASVITVWYKLKDNSQDEGFFKKLLAKTAMLFAKRGYKKAAVDEPELDRMIGESIRLQWQTEQKQDVGLDESADPTGKMMQSVLIPLASDESQRRILDVLGYQLGRWIYFMDASDDLEEDIKKSRFNPIALRFKLDRSSEQNALKEAKEDANGVMNMCVALILSSAALLEYKRFGGVLENIFSEGLAAAQEKVLKGEKAEKPIKY